MFKSNARNIPGISMVVTPNGASVHYCHQDTVPVSPQKHCSPWSNDCHEWQLATLVFSEIKNCLMKTTHLRNILSRVLTSRVCVKHPSLGDSFFFFFLKSILTGPKVSFSPSQWVSLDLPDLQWINSSQEKGSERRQKCPHHYTSPWPSSLMLGIGGRRSNLKWSPPPTQRSLYSRSHECGRGNSVRWVVQRFLL